MKQLVCPHLASISGIQRFCMKGYFPMNCETCNCSDKYYVDTVVTTSTWPTDSSLGKDSWPGYIKDSNNTGGKDGSDR